MARRFNASDTNKGGTFMVFKCSAGMTVMLVVALLSAGCSSRTGRTPPVIHQVLVSVIPANGDVIAVAVSNDPDDHKNVNVVADGHSHNIHWDIDNKTANDWQFSTDSTNPSVQFDTAGAQHFQPDPGDRSTGQRFIFRDKLDDGTGIHAYHYQITIYAKPPNTHMPLIVQMNDPAITNHGR